MNNLLIHIPIPSDSYASRQRCISWEWVCDMATKVAKNMILEVRIQVDR
ncbi:hypothetical protein P1X15_04540 [Runella sp. MFBS21]|nr:hypothetical protein [Runella sp. MFBS21]MDF7816848.1 hypothetical protein [Runella sp. MFBS21]